jgi:hypothetical protein
MRDADGELDHLEAALDVALGVGMRLAVLAGDEVGEFVGIRGWQSSRNFISTRARRCGLVAAHAGCAAFAFSTAARSFGDGGQRDVAAHGRRSSAGRPRRCGRSGRRRVLPPMKCPYLEHGLAPDCREAHYDLQEWHFNARESASIVHKST